jgi:hypothetical protein
VPQPVDAKKEHAASSLAPPYAVVPYKSPFVAWTSLAAGPSPSVHPLWAQEL